jgi:hypothetical protein
LPGSNIFPVLQNILLNWFQRKISE